MKKRLLALLMLPLAFAASADADFSYRDLTSTTREITAKALELGYKPVGLTDKGTLEPDVDSLAFVKSDVLVVVDLCENVDRVISIAVSDSSKDKQAVLDLFHSHTQTYKEKNGVYSWRLDPQAGWLRSSNSQNDNATTFSVSTRYYFDEEFVPGKSPLFDSFPLLFDYNVDIGLQLNNAVVSSMWIRHNYREGSAACE